MFRGNFWNSGAERWVIRIGANDGWPEPLGELVRMAYQLVLKCVDEKKQATHANGQPVSVIG
jgi:hypothetical protein